VFSQSERVDDEAMMLMDNNEAVLGSRDLAEVYKYAVECVVECVVERVVVCVVDYVVEHIVECVVECAVVFRTYCYSCD
jgi:hypothetical protein